MLPMILGGKTYGRFAAFVKMGVDRDVDILGVRARAGSRRLEYETSREWKLQ